MINLLLKILFFTFLLTYSYANIDDKINKDLSKSFKKYDKEIQKIQKKISNLKKSQSKDVQKIDPKSKGALRSDVSDATFSALKIINI